VTTTKGARLDCPAARFVQWKAVLTAAAGESPELESVDVAYLPKNLEPRVEEIEITPPNFKFPSPSMISSGPATLSLPPMGKRRSEGSGGSGESITSTPMLTYSKGTMSVRWAASDPNGDALTYALEIRGEKETTWKLVKDKLRDKYWSFDGTALADGEYRVRVTASDAPGNPPAEALTGQLESDPFTIDNTPPVLTGPTVTRTGSRIEVKWRAADALNDIKEAEYSLDGGDWIVAAPVGRLSDSLELEYVLTLDGVAAGEHTVAVRVSDDYENQVAGKVVVK
jgi:hypothetical protein